jgi:hypothetical protein
MKPDKPGIWEWFDEDGTKRLVNVCDCTHGVSPIYLRVYFWGGYYNVNDEGADSIFAPFDKAEWSDRWGRFVGEIGSIPEDQLYLGPTPEQFEKLKTTGRL